LPDGAVRGLVCTLFDGIVIPESAIVRSLPLAKKLIVTLWPLEGEDGELSVVFPASVQSYSTSAPLAGVSEAL
jgi:hypothetical protein